MSERETSNSEAQPSSGKLGSRIAAVAILVFAGVVFYEAIRVSEQGGLAPSQPGFFPMIVGVGLLVFGGVFLLQTTLWPDRELTKHAAESQAETHWLSVGLVAAVLLVYVFVLGVLGYIVATALFFVTVAQIVGSHHLIRDIAIGIGLSVVIYFGFTELLGVRLPAGLLEPIL